MREIKPDFYDIFKCKANSCKYSCCKENWDIEVDNKSLKKYCSTKEFEQIENYIDFSKHKNCLKKENGKCKFLCDDGLCYLIKKYDYSYLCTVCDKFPRYNSQFYNIISLNLSFCCEEVINKVLSKQDKIEFIVNQTNKKNNKIDDEKMQLFFHIYNTIFDEYLSFFDAIKKIYSLHIKNTNEVDFNKIFVKEKIEKLFDKFEWILIDNNKFSNIFEKMQFQNNFAYTDIQLKNLFICFVYNYFFNQNKFLTAKSIILFSIFSIFFCNDLTKNTFYKNLDNKVASILEYSRQIESSDINLIKLIKCFNEL